MKYIYNLNINKTKKEFIDFIKNEFEDDIKINNICEYNNFDTNKFIIICYFDYKNESHKITINYDTFDIISNKTNLFDDILYELLEYIYVYIEFENIKYDIKEVLKFNEPDFNIRYFNFNNKKYEIKFKIDILKSKNLISTLSTRYLYSYVSNKNNLKLIIKEFENNNLLSKIEDKPFVYKIIKI